MNQKREVETRTAQLEVCSEETRVRRRERRRAGKSPRKCNMMNNYQSIIEERRGKGLEANGGGENEAGAVVVVMVAMRWWLWLTHVHALGRTFSTRTIFSLLNSDILCANNGIYGSTIWLDMNGITDTITTSIQSIWGHHTPHSL